MSEEKRTAVLYVRMADSELEEFEKDAEKRNMTKAEFLRYIWQAFRDSLTKKGRAA